MQTNCSQTTSGYIRNPEYRVAMAYVPLQNFGTLYDPEKALIAGTLFPELDKPFVGRRAFRR